jgi:VIT1/CCC1 family predicted Fe2+/Mn2+ transporter
MTRPSPADRTRHCVARAAWLSRTTALITAIVLSALVLFGVGVYESVTLVGDWRKNGLKMVVIGLGAAAIGFLIGRLFHTAGA